MFDIGWGELVVIGIVALVVIGPKELPAVLRTLGQGMTKLRRMASDFQSQFNDAMREAELEELKKQAEKLASDATAATTYDPLNDVGEQFRSIESSVTAEPAKTPTQTSAAEAAPAAAPEPAPPAKTESSAPPAEPADETGRAVSGGGRGA